MYPGNMSLAQKYLENKVSSGVVSNYSLCLVAYALALANSPVAGNALAELIRRADYIGNSGKVILCSGMCKSHMSTLMPYHQTYNLSPVLLSLHYIL